MSHFEDSAGPVAWAMAIYLCYRLFQHLVEFQLLEGRIMVFSGSWEAFGTIFSIRGGEEC